MISASTEPRIIYRRSTPRITVKCLRRVRKQLVGVLHQTFRRQVKHSITPEVVWWRHRVCPFWSQDHAVLTWRHRTLLSVHAAVTILWRDWWSALSVAAFPDVLTASTTTTFNCDLCVIGIDTPGCWLAGAPPTLPPLPALLLEWARRRRTAASPARIASRAPVAYLDGVSVGRRPIPGPATDGAGLRLSASPGSQYVLRL